MPYSTDSPVILPSSLPVIPRTEPVATLQTLWSTTGLARIVMKELTRSNDACAGFDGVVAASRLLDAFGYTWCDGSGVLESFGRDPDDPFFMTRWFVATP